MKKLFIALCLLTGSLGSFSQSCEERENKLLEAMGSFSAGQLYNTYGVIGSISDGYVHDAYDAATVADLMDAQKRLTDNLVKVLEELGNENILRAQSDKDYAVTAIKILKGLGRQAQLLEDYVANKSTQKQEAYDTQRKLNWKDISKLMGIGE